MKYSTQRKYKDSIIIEVEKVIKKIEEPQKKEEKRIKYYLNFLISKVKNIFIK
jgi:hypothetical protein